MRIEIYEIEDGFGYRIISSENIVILEQSFNPFLNGFALMSKEEAEEIAGIKLEELLNQEIIVEEPEPPIIPEIPPAAIIELAEIKRQIERIEQDSANMLLMIFENIDAFEMIDRHYKANRYSKLDIAKFVDNKKITNGQYMLITGDEYK